MVRKCSSLREGEQVVFLIYSGILNKKTPMDGSVIFVSPKTEKVAICWLEGYKSRTDFIPFCDMLAVHNPEGEMIKFGNLYGRSDRLIAK